MLSRRDHLDKLYICGMLPNIRIVFSRINFFCIYEFSPTRFWQSQNCRGGHRWQIWPTIMKFIIFSTRNFHFLLISEIMSLWMQISLENWLKTMHTRFWPLRKKIRVYKYVWVIEVVELDKIKRSDTQLTTMVAQWSKNRGGTMGHMVRNMSKI